LYFFFIFMIFKLFFYIEQEINKMIKIN
jgi:hypothetical protein